MVDDKTVVRVPLHGKEKVNHDRERFMATAQATDDGCWLKHTDYHWSRNVQGKRLDYWPSRKKFGFDGRIMRGDVYDFIRRQNAAAQGS